MWVNPSSSEPGYIVVQISVSTPFKGFRSRRGKPLKGLRWKVLWPCNPALKEPGFLKGTPLPIDVVLNMGTSNLSPLYVELTGRKKLHHKGATDAEAAN